jgi:hypothetical protein
MPTSDISRWSTDFRKRYDGVRLQQGRVLTDDDFNEAGRLDAEDERKTRVDVIGPTGSPDSGFLVQNPRATNGLVDFDILQGTLYLGGLRLRLDAPSTYLGQSDFLQIDAVPAPAQERLDLVYIETWQQHVSAVEDNELFEVALGGPDTSTRLKTMQRVHIASGVGTENCHDAFAGVISGLTGTLNGELELTVDARLTVSFDPGGVPADLCSPPIQGGYLGAENQAIRVELIDASNFTWGFDDASPLYRAEIHNNSGGQARIVHLLTAPKDQAHWPLAGQTIEILPWAAILPNQEKVTDTSGFIAKADGSYNPDTQDFSIDTPVPAGFGLGWQQRTDAAALAAAPQFVYVRIWNRGSDTASPAALPFSPNTSVALGQTGLLVQFTGTQFRRGDHWVIAARPDARDEVVPWQLMESREPHGYRRYYAPLAVIRWSQTGNTVSGVVIDDCRETFPPLTRLRTCCTYTVGDGIVSFGHFTSIQKAIDMLPAAGGEICVLPGTYRGNIHILDRSWIRIHGCGRRSLIVPDDKDPSALITITDSQHIRLDSLRLESGERSAIVADVQNPKIVNSDLTFEKLEIQAAWVAMNIEAAQNVRILSNSISLTGTEFRAGLPPESLAPAVIVRADNVLIEGNSILIGPHIGRIASALGGIQLRGGCERVEIRRNLIRGGNGNGITLGSFRLEPPDKPPVSIFPGGVLTFDDDGCPVIVVDPVPPGDPSQPQPVSEGFLYDILIRDNRIEATGMSGIAGAFAFVFSVSGAFSIAGSTVVKLEISENRIEGCLMLDLGPFPLLFEDRLAFGGVALQFVQDLLIRDNRIENNGAAHASPVCGVFAVDALGAVIEENLISGNGPSSSGGLQTLFGTRGGVILPSVRGGGIIKLLTAVAAAVIERGVDFAAHVHNNVISTPLGPALRIGGNGAISVLGNFLASHGFTRRIDIFVPIQPSATAGAAGASNTFTAHRDFLATVPVRSRLQEVLASAVVTIMNRGQLTDAAGTVPEFGVKESVLNRLSTADPVERATAAVTIGGHILFDDNQVYATVDANNFPPRFCIVLMSADDISMQSNQSDYQSQQPFVTNTFVYGPTVRVNGNRFQEPRPVGTISAITAGILNITSLNVATHCIVPLPLGAIVDSGNLPDSCRQLAPGVMNTLLQLLAQP